MPLYKKKEGVCNVLEKNDPVYEREGIKNEADKIKIK